MIFINDILIFDIFFLMIIVTIDYINEDKYIKFNLILCKILMEFV